MYRNFELFEQIATENNQSSEELLQNFIDQYIIWGRTPFELLDNINIDETIQQYHQFPCLKLLHPNVRKDIFEILSLDFPTIIEKIIVYGNVTRFNYDNNKPIKVCFIVSENENHSANSIIRKWMRKSPSYFTNVSYTIYSIAQLTSHCPLQIYKGVIIYNKNTSYK